MNNLLDYQQESPIFDYNLIEKFKQIEYYEEASNKYSKFSKKIYRKIQSISKDLQDLKEFMKEDIKFWVKN